MSAYAGLWAGLHVQVSKLTACPEIAITLDDSKAFLQAAQNVARHYSIPATQKTLDWAAFAITASLIYTPRIVAIRQRLRTPEPPPQQRQAAPVFRFVQPQQPPPNPAGPFAEPAHATTRDVPADVFEQPDPLLDGLTH